MKEIDAENLAQIAAKFVNSTNRHIFLTGKAGTGKTTFLNGISKSTHKKCLIAAPTGIAAINAKGVTLHSLLQLPFGCFIPSEIPEGHHEFSVEINTPKTLLKQKRFNKNKLAMLREMELLIIDEVSMLRADLLDAIDHILRSLRRQRHVPFGGVQMLFIGDLMQLPPVVKDAEWKYLSPYYKSAYFFEAHALKEAAPVYIELEKIYRQTEQEFIDILNRFRNNRPTQDDLATLNQHFVSDYKSKVDEGYIFITTHNFKADEKNRTALAQLPGESFKYSAQVSDDFPDHTYPVEYNLVLKKNARVMFIKNDISGEGRYYNGKIGVVSHLNDDEIVVEFDDGSESVTLERYTWENKRYTLNEETREIEEKVIGTFSHYPVKLAWAVTVHKSQGLTFEKAVLDLSGAFAPGQVYVALSRLRSLKGLALSSLISSNSLNIDKFVSSYAENKVSPAVLSEKLNDERLHFISSEIYKAFDFRSLKDDLKYHYYSYDKDTSKSEKQKYKLWAQQLLHKIDEPLDVADKFCNQIGKIINSKNNDLPFLMQRVVAAKGYFEPILKDFSNQIAEHIKELGVKKKVKAYINDLNDLDSAFFRQRYFIYKSEAILKSAIEKTEISRDEIQKSKLFEGRKELVTEKKESLKKTEKGKEKVQKIPTREITFNLYREGKNIDEIALERNLTPGTIQGHFIPYLKNGKVKVTDIVNKKKVKAILKYINENNPENSTQVKHALGDDFTYGEIQLVMASVDGD